MVFLVMYHLRWLSRLTIHWLMLRTWCLSESLGHGPASAASPASDGAAGGGPRAWVPVTEFLVTAFNIAQPWLMQAFE